MRNISLKSKKGKLKINSHEIKEILETKADFERIRDISDTINEENILVYDCKLDSEVFDMELIEDVIAEIKLKDETINVSVRFDDIKAYVKDLCEEIESDLEDIFNLEDVNCYFDIYSINEKQNDFKFVFLISFSEKITKSIINLSEIIGRRQLLGESKYYS